MSFADWGKRPYSDDDDDDNGSIAYTRTSHNQNISSAAVPATIPANGGRRHNNDIAGIGKSAKKYEHRFDRTNEFRSSSVPAATSRSRHNTRKQALGRGERKGRGMTQNDPWMDEGDSIIDMDHGGDAVDYHALGEEIRSNIEQIARRNVDLEKSLSRIGGRSDTDQFRHELAHTIENTVKIAKSTEQKMHQLKTIASSSGGVSMSVTDVDQPKFLYEKLKKEFTRCMTKFKQVTDSLQKKQKDFVVRAKKTVQKQRIGSTDAQDGPSALDERTHLLQTQKFQEENFLLENAIQHNESLIAEREEEILDIESNILEINDIFRELNIMVHEQGGHLNIIEDNIEDTSVKVKLGNENLKKASKYDKKGRMLLCLILVVVIAVIAAVAIALVVLKSLRIV